MKKSFHVLLTLIALLCTAYNATFAAVTFQDGWPRPNNDVEEMLYANGVLYAVGNFTMVGGVSRNGGCAIDVATGTLLPWNPQGGALGPGYLGFGPKSIAKKGDTIFIAGNFSTLGGQPATCFGAVNTTTGSRITWGPALANGEGVVGQSGSGARLLRTDKVVVSDNAVYIGGSFDSIGGIQRNNIAAVDAATGAVLSFNLGLERPADILDMKLNGNTLYMMGRFTSIQGQQRKVMASVNAVTGAVTSWNPFGTGAYYDGGVRDFDISENSVYMVGTFTTLQGQVRKYACAVDTNTGLLLPWNPNMYDITRSVAVGGNTVYLGGVLTSLTAYGNLGVAANTTTGAIKSWTPKVFGYLNCILPVGNTIFLGGATVQMDGDATRKNLVAVSAQSDVIAGTTVASQTSGCGPGYNVNLSLTGTSGAENYQWQSSRDDISYTNIAGATNAAYSLYVSDTTWFRCKVSAAGTPDDFSSKVRVLVTKPAPSVSIDVPSLLCLNEDALFTLTTANLGTAPTYQWYFKDSLVSTSDTYLNERIDANTPEELYVVVGNVNLACGTATGVESEHLMLKSNPSPDRNTIYTTASGSTKLCEGDTVTFTSKASLNPLSAGATYSWYSSYTYGDPIDGATGPSFTATQGGSYYMVVTYASGCSRQSPPRFIHYVPHIDVSPTWGYDSVICAGGSTQLEATDAGNAIYRWKLNGSNKGTTRIITATAPGTYSISVSVDGCPANADTIIVTEKAVNLDVTPSGTTSFCAPGTIMLNATFNLGYLYQWYKGSTAIAGETNSSYAAPTSGSYRVGIRDYYCYYTPEKKSATIAVTANITPTATISRVTKQNSYWLLRANPGITGYAYQWYKDGALIADSVRRDFVATSNGSYTTVVSNGSCASAMSPAYVVNATTFPASGARTAAGITEDAAVINIFPNPSTGIFYIGSEEPLNAMVKDLQGRTVIDSKDVSQIDLSAQAPGIYLLLLTSREGEIRYTEKIIKQ